MCGRYVTPAESEIERFWHIGRHNANPLPRRFNVSPTAIVPILHLDRATGELEIVQARWGLIPPWWKDAKPPRSTHNARSEEAASKPMWKGPLAKTRCLVPAVGWYEWKAVERTDPATGEIRTVKQPHFFYLPNEELIVFAGVMAMWKPANDDAWQASCAILTRDAVGPAAEVHDRMPVALDRDDQIAWLDPKNTNTEELLEMARARSVTQIEHHPVSARVNSSGADDEGLIRKEP